MFCGRLSVVRLLTIHSRYMVPLYLVEGFHETCHKHSSLHYTRVVYSGLSTRLLNHYYSRCTELDTENRKKMIGEKT